MNIVFWFVLGFSSFQPGRQLLFEVAFLWGLIGAKFVVNCCV
jgi:hypothetical protein